ncbi:multidrug effflux MFS transporter [Sphingomicrobium sediminis]|uniref:Multidrug effflux MFS transporter n=1 Tax=Sphingomicrobium sediminis TaxID=2950949 RepID=A0A9X2EGH1_9SPHN|nr:multidrug effflux MFS transporter [Sphingomicrobium sediminis]MCM8556941.1 multidrug effflux MFS transporter [Sphingomicrobium sediminis]
MDATPSQKTKRKVSEREIVALLASFMALNAFALDTMLPALPDIGLIFGLIEANSVQLVIVAYTFGFGASQLFWGPLADRFGRKRILTAGVAGYVGFALVCALAPTFAVLVAARFMMGFCGAISRVLVTAIVRDLYEGEAMARIMSLTFMVFMVVPVMAPSIGQVILLGFEWRAIFFALAAYGAIVLVWGGLRLPETLHPEHRRSLDAVVIGRAIIATIVDRLSRGYTIALGFVFGCLIAYLASIPQILGEIFARPEAIGWVFAAVAAPMGVASWGNSRIVGRFGLRRVGHSGIIGFAAASIAHLIWHLAFGSTLASFVIFMAIILTSFAFTAANLGTLAMTNMAPIAGTASSVQGTFSTIWAAVFGLVIGQMFDGSLIPILLAFAGAGAMAFLLILWTEHGRLFETGTRRQQADCHPVDC